MGRQPCGLVTRPRQEGVRAPGLAHLEERGDPVMSQPGLADVHQVLSDPDGASVMLLPALAPNTDVVRTAETAKTRMVQFTGFHPPEATGLWTALPKATLRARVASDHPVTALSGSASLLDAALAHSAQTVPIEATEETTGRSTRWQDTRPQGGDPSFDWVLPLPRFTGPLRVELTLPACHSPRTLGASSDPRPLGLMLRSLRFDSAPAQLEAAE